MDNPADIEQAYPDPFPPPSRYALPLFPTRVIYVLLVLNGLIFILDYLTQRQVFSMGALVPGLVIVYHQWWRLVTAGFIHADFIHIAFNLYALYGLGILVERFFGPTRSLGIYFLSLLGANVFVTLFSPWTIPTVGASGAIMGVLGAALCYFWRYRNMLSRGKHYLSELIKMAAINIAIGLLPGISLWGHAGGLLTGLIMGWIFLPDYQPVGTEVVVLRIQPLKRRAWGYILAVILVQLGLIAVAFRLRTG